MTTRVDAQTLSEVAKALGLSGAPAAQTEFSDGHLDQVVDVARYIRRGRTPAQTTGWYYIVLENAHGAPGDKKTLVDPYNPTLANVQAPYPAPVPLGWDLWLASAHLVRSSGTGTVVGAALSIDPVLLQRAIGQDDAGGPITTDLPMTLKLWNGTFDDAGAILGTGTFNGNFPDPRIGIRLRRNAKLQFDSTNGVTGCDLQCYVLVGLFPAGSGQDVAV